jgi:23S rRNA (uracil1939-C5)-methyltransferase
MTDRCAHFGECGGCRRQDVPYPDQLDRKRTALTDLFRPYWNGPVAVEPSPEIWHYRNKVDFSFAGKFYPEPPPRDVVREPVLGFKVKGRWYRPLEISECRIAPEGIAALLEAVRKWMRSQGLQAFDSRSRRGFLRALVVREGRRTGKRMVVLITTDGDFDRKSFVEAVHEAYPASSIQRGIFRGLADVATAEEIEVLDGSATIEERLIVPDDAAPRELRFRLSPFSFFQTNTLGAERLYARIRRWVRETARGTLFDLYGGTGGIALTCADLVAHVHSVERVTSASLDGVRNAEMNAVQNVHFITDSVEGYLRKLCETDAMDADCAVVVDPPRPGLHPKALRRLVDLRPPAVLYVSCKPPVLARELPVLLETYRLTGLAAVDLFPHTEHVEVLAFLSR